jgi:hypothetical protein
LCHVRVSLGCRRPRGRVEAPGIAAIRQPLRIVPEGFSPPRADGRAGGRACGLGGRVDRPPVRNAAISRIRSDTRRATPRKLNRDRSGKQDVASVRKIDDRPDQHWRGPRRCCQGTSGVLAPR